MDPILPHYDEILLKRCDLILHDYPLYSGKPGMYRNVRFTVEGSLKRGAGESGR